jgi:hypothetical protein
MAQNCNLQQVVVLVLIQEKTASRFEKQNDSTVAILQTMEHHRQPSFVVWWTQALIK